jgi:hypothetical protein
MRVRVILARGAQVDAALPIEPVRAGLGQAAVPAQTAVELGNQREPAIGARVQMPGELGDLRDQVRGGEARFAVGTVTIPGISEGCDYIQYVTDNLLKCKRLSPFPETCWACEESPRDQTFDPL